jgi:DnaJ-class molecular chaperone
MENQVTTSDGANGPCKCCSGTGTQYNALTGQIETCRCCGGTGKWGESTNNLEIPE